MTIFPMTWIELCQQYKRKAKMERKQLSWTHSLISTSIYNWSTFLHFSVMWAFYLKPVWVKFISFATEKNSASLNFSIWKMWVTPHISPGVKHYNTYNMLVQGQA
jgi:hypothetical protein